MTIHSWLKKESNSITTKSDKASNNNINKKLRKDKELESSQIRVWSRIIKRRITFQ